MAKTDYLHSIINVPPATPLVGFVGRLSHEKGPEIFVQIASMIHKKCDKYHFVLIGDGPLRRKLKDDIDNMGLNDHVHMAGLQIDMPQVYSSLDLVVSTSYSEAMPLAMIEAMAAGLPVIATNVGGVIDIVEIGRTGLLNGVGDLNGMANNIVTLMSDESARIEMGKAARKRAEANFDLSNCVSQTSELLSSLAQVGYQGERSIGQC
jgi:glycosyltransferase involved in cell wall biosynthesis